MQLIFNIPTFLAEKIINSYENIKNLISTHSEAISFTLANAFILYSIHSVLNKKNNMMHYQRQMFVLPNKQQYLQQSNKSNNNSAITSTLNSKNEINLEPYHPTNHSPHIVLKEPLNNIEIKQDISILHNLTDEDELILMRLFDKWYSQKETIAFDNLVKNKYPFLTNYVKTEELTNNSNDNELKLVMIDDYCMYH
jgi:hypothetical protein